MNKRIYTQILKEPFKSLGYYVDEIFENKCNFNFFNIIATKIVPLIRTQIFEKLHVEYINKKKTYINEQYLLKNNASIEIEKAFTALKDLLKQLSLNDDVEIKNSLSQIEEIFNKKNINTIPSYIENANQKICLFLEDLLDKGYIDLVKQFAIVEEYPFNNIKRLYIKEFIFVPSLLKLKGLNDLWQPKNVQLTWIAWEYLSLIEWCWSTSIDFFHIKDNEYNIENNANYATNIPTEFLSFHNYWILVSQIKNQNNYNTEPLTRENYTKYIKLIVNEVILNQRRELIPLYSEIEGTENISIYKIGLRLQYPQLLLDVEEIQGLKKTYLISYFKGDSAPYNFIKALLESKPLEEINMQKINGCASGGNVAKYFEGMKINNVIGRLFFGKRKTYSTHLKTKMIEGKNISNSDKIELSLLIETFTIFKNISD